MSKPGPILVSHLFRAVDALLIVLLRQLSDEDWQRPTLCSEWCVRDIAAHLLDGNVRRLSAQRDGYTPIDAPGGFDSYRELVEYLNRFNAEWTRAARRLSPRVMIELLELTGASVSEMFEAADPYADALFAVRWAGEERSVAWMDIAREYTERWYHQRQIADAVGRATRLDEPRLYHPVLETFLRALPHTYRDAPAPDGTAVCVEIRGAAGGRWYLIRESAGWHLRSESSIPATATVRIDQASAWKLFTKRTDQATALARFPSIRIDGDAALGGRTLEMVSIMA